MTVEELRNELAKFDGSLPVVAVTPQDDEHVLISPVTAFGFYSGDDPPYVPLRFHLWVAPMGTIEKWEPPVKLKMDSFK